MVGGTMRIALTSAREGSKRLYRKELQELGGKCVIDWTLEQMMECKSFDLRILSTDWKELIDYCKPKYPDIIFIERKKELALSETPAQLYITNALEPYHAEGNEYCLLQSTSPLRPIDLIYLTNSEFTEKWQSLFTVNKYTLYPDGQIYWFRDIYDHWKSPALPILCEPTVQLDYPHDLVMARYLVDGGSF
jgi:CMP-N-acetylneuraminic acid synthetase